MKIINKLINGEEFTIRRIGEGSFRKNCMYCTAPEQVPSFLINDGAATLIDGGVELNAIEGKAFRKFPVYICWEAVSEENREKVPGNYGAWPKDNGDTTLVVKDGKCYNLPATMRAAFLADNIPAWVTAAGFPIQRLSNSWDLFRKDWGDHRKGEIGKAIWVEYSVGDINILSIKEDSAKEYVISFNGTELGILSEVFN